MDEIASAGVGGVAQPVLLRQGLGLQQEVPEMLSVLIYFRIAL